MMTQRQQTSLVIGIGQTHHVKLGGSTGTTFLDLENLIVEPDKMCLGLNYHEIEQHYVANLGVLSLPGDSNVYCGNVSKARGQTKDH
jgi:hypothetical protein